jgi:ABC-2 type transport system permease protein
MRILLNELLKTYTRWRTYIGFMAIGVFVPLVEVALKLEGGAIARNATRGLASDFLILGNVFNAYFVTHFMMLSLWVHVPFLISLVAGDQLAGEATGGTFRILLIRPPSRSRILWIKYLTTLIYTCSLVLFLGILSLSLGIPLFGTGDLLIPGNTISIIPEADAPWRLAAAFGFAVVSMWCVASLAFLFSSLVENAIGPIIATMTVIVVFLLIGNIPVSLFSSIRPYLFTTYTNVWQEVLAYDVQWAEVAQHAGYLTLYSIGFYIATWYIFVKKDVLS